METDSSKICQFWHQRVCLCSPEIFANVMIQSEAAFFFSSFSLTLSFSLFSTVLKKTRMDSGQPSTHY